MALSELSEDGPQTNAKSESSPAIGNLKGHETPLSPIGLAPAQERILRLSYETEGGGGGWGEARPLRSPPRGEESALAARFRGSVATC